MTTLITGNTFPVKEKLKALGGRWNAAAIGWDVPTEKAEEANQLVAAAGPAPARTFRQPRNFRARSVSRFQAPRGKCIDAPCCGCCDV